MILAYRVYIYDLKCGSRVSGLEESEVDSGIEKCREGCTHPINAKKYI